MESELPPHPTRRISWFTAAGCRIWTPQTMQQRALYDAPTLRKFSRRVRLRKTGWLTGPEPGRWI
ncbi:MAG TPA: hypothetical protein VFG14_02785 [Chthoniobacteraceae bacterium]|nr:hypothetical protein [Chthoniobacteraceae bacterium]